MASSFNAVLRDRLHAAILLGEMLEAYKNSNAIVVAIPCSGVSIGYYLARLLNLPLEIVQCKKLKGPSSSHKYIGAVASDYVVTNDDLRDIPQSYFDHQVKMLQQSIKEKDKVYRGDIKPVSLKKRTVILVNDELTSGNALHACIGSIQKQAPEKIIVAVPVANPDAYYELLPLTDDIVFLFKDREPSTNMYQVFPPVSDEEVKNLFALAHEEYEAHQYVM